MHNIEFLTDIRLEPSVELDGFLRFVNDFVVRYRGETYKVPAGFVSDGASIPDVLTLVCGSKFKTPRVYAAFVHDYHYWGGNPDVDRAEADDLYRDMQIALGVPRWKAYLEWKVLRLFGWSHWCGDPKKAGRGRWFFRLLKYLVPFLLGFFVLGRVFGGVVIVTNAAYTAAFDTDSRCPAWVSYDLEPGEIVVKNRASIPFRADPRIAESDNAADYSGSGYDRGHMAPAADFNFDRIALGETYLYSNICPQRPELNRGQWADIERQVRDLALDRGTVHVVTVAEFDGTNRIGRVRVPSAFVKVAFGAFGARVWCVENAKGAKGNGLDE